MSQGKFTNPRPYRDEERQIEETFRQLTDKQPVKKAPPPPQPKAAVSQATTVIPSQAAPEAASPFLDPELEELLREPTPRPMPSQEAFPKPLEDSFPFDFDEPDSQEPEPEEDFLDKAMAFFNRNRMYVLAALFVAALLLIGSVAAVFASSARDPYDGKILPNIYVGELPLGGMTKEQAISALKLSGSQTYESQDMVIDLELTELRLTPADTGAKLDAAAAAEAAFAYGRTGSDEDREKALAELAYAPYVVEVLPYLELDTQFVRETITGYAENTGATLTQTTYGLEGIQPKLDAENFDEKAPTQTLVITLGTPGIGFDAAQVYQQVLDAYAHGVFLVEVENVEAVKDPDPVDLEAIYKEFYIEPVDASLDHRNEVIPGAYGYDFDLDAAQALIDAAEFGEEIRIPMQYVEPAILDADMFFRDVLGGADTRHADNKNLATNLRLACDAIHGLVLDPGETFSFNNTVGQRTTAKGYKEAPAYYKGELMDVLGGGVSQVASTLYKAALLADMEIVNRTNHEILPDYIDRGVDASIAWGSEDLRFRNSSDYPIQLEASVSNGTVNIQILGTDMREYYIKLESETLKTYKPDTVYEDYDFDNDEGVEDGDVIRKGITGYQIKTYKVRYDNANGSILGRDLVATSRYIAVDEIIARVEEPEETTEETEPETEPPTEAPKPTEPPVTQPKPTEPAPTEPKPTETKPVETLPPETEPPATEAPASETEAPTAETEGTEA